MTDDEQEALYLNAGRADEYKLRRMGFEPDVLYDIGADCGSVTMFAHSIFPQTKIVSVEPNPWSFPRLAKNAAYFNERLGRVCRELYLENLAAFDKTFPRK